MNDEAEIRRTLAEFGQYLDERRFDEWSQLFAEDAIFMRLQRRDAIRSFMLGEELATMPELFRKHVTSNLVIKLEGDRAHVESDLVLFERLGGGPWILRFGKYIDDMVRDVDRWRIQERQLSWTANGLDVHRAGEGA
jgi:3-phenylpropionate/cinnamic acid dioxygenase small subunit